MMWNVEGKLIITYAIAAMDNRSHLLNSDILESFI